MQLKKSMDLFKKKLKAQYDVVIIGGGIVGLGLFRDLSLQGVSSLVLEKGDFASQTSSRSSKMLHGGIRYLEYFDFGLIKEALHEKNLWLKLAPHLCYEMPFHMPIFKESKYPLSMLKMGLFTYDLLSSFENTPHRVLNQSQTLEEFPQLKKQGLRGSGVYYDAVVDDSKLALECLYDGLLEKKGHALNYFEVKEVKKTGAGFQVTAKDRLSDEVISIFAKDVVFATGPFTDKVMAELKVVPWTPQLLPTKGIHLWLKNDAFKLRHPLVLQTKDDRVIFVIPERGAILVGTTESHTQEDFFDIEATSQEIYYLLENVGHFFPGANLSEDQIISTYAGIRPLVRQEGRNSHKTSRHHKLYQPLSNLHVLVGGKYTTFRTMVQDLARILSEKNKRHYNPDASKRPLRMPSVVRTFDQHSLTSTELQQILQQEGARTFQDLILRRLGLLSAKSWKNKSELAPLLSPLQDSLR